ncbi:MAG TPA: ABC transporter ATP-binding protein [Solirubrobacteraceae bacterium]
MLLSLRGVTAGYRRGPLTSRVLADVSLELCAREVVSVLAMRGQGKSTLLRVAAGMQRPDAGRVLLDGDDLWLLGDALRQQLLRGRIAWVESSPPGVDVSVLEHVVVPLLVGRAARRGAHARARAALERVGAAGCAGQRWEELSDWDRALVAIAAGVVRQPQLLVVDDLTSTLGLKETDEVTRLLHSLARETGAAVLMGVSDANATQWSDRIATLAGGELLENADAGESDPGKVASLADHSRLRSS